MHDVQVGVWQWRVLFLSPPRLSRALGLSVEVLNQASHRMQQGLALSLKMLRVRVGAGYGRWETVWTQSHNPVSV